MKQMLLCDTITMCIACIKLCQRLQTDANSGLMLYYKLGTSLVNCHNASIVDFIHYIFYIRTFLIFQLFRKEKNNFWQ